MALLSLACFESFVAPTSKGGVQGANVASIDYFTALRKYGNNKIERIYYFPASEADKEAFLYAYNKTEAGKVAVEVAPLFSLPQFLKQGKIDAFFCSSLLSTFEKTVSYRNRYAPQLPVTTLIHSISYAEYAELYSRLAFIGLKAYDTIICSSKAGMEVIKKSFQQAEELLFSSCNTTASLSCNIVHIPLGIYTENFRGRNRAEARKALGFSENETILLSFGRFSPYDKMDLLPLLRAFKELLKSGKCKNVRLILAGSRTPNNYPAILEQFIQQWSLSEYVTLLCDTDDATKQNLYAAADIFVSPSDNFQETFGLTILEASASGLAVIASDFDGYKELVVHNETGFLTPSLWCEPSRTTCDLLSLTYENNRHLILSQGFVVSCEKLTAQIDELIDNKQKREAFSQKAKSFAEAFRWKKIIPKHIELFNTVCKIANGESKHKTKNPPHNAIAQPSSSTPLLFQLSYARLFSHYPTEILSKKHLFKITQSGEAILSGKEKFSIYADMTEVLHSSLLRQLLFLCRKGSPSFENIKSNVGMKEKGLEELTAYHLLWLTKHHYLDYTSASSLQ